MNFDKNTTEIIKFVRKMQATDRFKKSIHTVTEKENVKIAKR